MNKKQFEKAFKKAVPNYNPIMCWFIHEKYVTYIHIVWDNSSWIMQVSKTQQDIDLWKGHFIEFFKTKNFDYHAYWALYDIKTGEQVTINDEIYRSTLIKKDKNDFYYYGTLNYNHPSLKKIGSLYGIKCVSREEALHKKIINL